MAFKFIFGLSLVVLASALPSKPAFWKGTPLESHIEKMRSACADEDSIACFQYKAFAFLDTILQKDYFKFGEMEVKRNSYSSNEVSSRSEGNFEEGVEEFIKTHDVKFTVPVIGDITVDSKGLDNDEIGLKLNFGSGSAVEARKKSKLKKIFIPILVFLLLKAITLVPLAIGILGLKAWNGLQLAFFSFIISTGLAIFQLCQKLAADSAHSTAHISAAGPWESAAVGPYAARSLNEAQNMAYSAYVQ
ncbi:uncharacterized protein [Leptinotarsa decemlineata]|uniref:uncharacterized protein n=1 Tax=Leptinotarsa decemlineata TaxID=7539 RepID=UPI003D30D510